MLSKNVYKINLEIWFFLIVFYLDDVFYVRLYWLNREPENFLYVKVIIEKADGLVLREFTKFW